MKNKRLPYPKAEAFHYVLTYFENELHISLSDIAKAIYETQSKYHISFSVDDYYDMLLELLHNSDVLSIAMTMIQLDRDANQKQLDKPLQTIIDNDLNVYAVDEILAMQIANIYSPTGITNYGYLDVKKHGLVKSLDGDAKHVNVFADDLISALIAAVGGLSLHKVAETDYE